MKLSDFLSLVGLKETLQVTYVNGYKYQLRQPILVHIGLEVDQNIITDLVIYRKDGWMLVRKYFAWDGASGPTIDTPATIIASAVHDAGYSLMRQELLSIAARPYFDEAIERLMIRDRGTGIFSGFLGRIRAKYYRWAVESFAERCATPNGAHRVKIAP